MGRISAAVIAERNHAYIARFTADAERRRVHELRIRDATVRVTWRIIYRIDPDAVVIADVFAKKTRKTPDEVIGRCQDRFARYDRSQS